MTRPAIAYSWAARRRTLLNDTSASEQTREDEHSNDPRWSAAMRLAARRSQQLKHGAEETKQALASLWVERVNTGYMAITLHPLAEEFALVADSGLQELIDLAAVYVARHYRGSSFDAAHCPPAARSSFGRLYQIQLGQFYLYGRFCEPSPVGLDGGQVAERVVKEATLFALAHELGHAVAATEHRAGHVHWLDEQQAPADLGHVAVEIEADAFAVACVSTICGVPASVRRRRLCGCWRSGSRSTPWKRWRRPVSCLVWTGTCRRGDGGTVSAYIWPRASPRGCWSEWTSCGKHWGALSPSPKRRSWCRHSRESSSRSSGKAGSMR